MRSSFVLLFFVFCQICCGQVDTTWTGGDGIWGDINSWDNGVPDIFSNAFLNSDAGEVVQNQPPFAIVSGLFLQGGNTRLVLENELSVWSEFEWNGGEIAGAQPLNVQGAASMSSARLSTTLNNSGTFTFGNKTGSGNFLTHPDSVWNNLNGSSLEFETSGIFGTIGSDSAGTLHNSVGAKLHFKSPAVYVLMDVYNDGLIEVEPGFQALFVNDFVQSESGSIHLNDSFIDFFRPSSFDGVITGKGSIINMTAPFSGTLIPGDSEIGTIGVTSLNMTSDARLDFQIGPNGSSDQVSNTGGDLQIEGTLNISALPGATTGTYTLFTYNNFFNLEYENLVLGDVPSGFSGEIFNDPSDMSIKIEVFTIDDVFDLGDINGDGQINLLDVQPFVDLLANGEYQASADINQDGEANLLDVDGFINILSN